MTYRYVVGCESGEHIYEVPVDSEIAKRTSARTIKTATAEECPNCLEHVPHRRGLNQAQTALANAKALFTSPSGKSFKRLR